MEKREVVLKFERSLFVFARILAIFFILLGIASVFKEPLVGIPFLMAGYLCIPSSRQKISETLKRPYTPTHNAIAVIFMVIVAILFIGKSPEDEAKELGFANAHQLEEAKKLGITTKADYDKLLAKEAAAQQQAEAEKAKAAKLAKDQADSICRDDLQCLAEKHFVEAAVSCPYEIERLAKYSVKWTDGMFEPKFSRYKWKNKDKGIITYIGDKIQFQNGFGAYQNHTYACDLDTDNDQVLNVEVYPGRI